MDNRMNLLFKYTWSAHRGRDWDSDNIGIFFPYSCGGLHILRMPRRNLRMSVRSSATVLSKKGFVAKAWQGDSTSKTKLCVIPLTGTFCLVLVFQFSLRNPKHINSGLVASTVGYQYSYHDFRS